MADEDVPSPVDFHDPAQARKWIEDTIQRKPWRSRFFAAFADALNDHFDHPFTVLELGSGPGHLAEQILHCCNIERYVALDFSTPMHNLAREKLSTFLDRVEFVEEDFRSPNWGESLGLFDAVVTMQAAHEVRHTRHISGFLAQARKRIKERGLLLYCDHYYVPNSGGNPALFLKPEAQPDALRDAGYSPVKKLHDEGGMALFSAAKFSRVATNQ